MNNISGEESSRLSLVQREAKGERSGDWNSPWPSNSELQDRLAAVYTELEVANRRRRQAEERVRLRDEYLANMTREIRTSLNGVISMVQLALETELTTEQRKYLASADSASESLLKTVDDTVDFWLIEAGALKLERDGFGLSTVIYEILELLAPAARQKGLALLLEVQPDVPAAVVGDQAKFRRVMLNLVSNAVKCTEQGTVSVAVASFFHSEDAVGIHLKVKATGKGLDREQFERALEPFEEAFSATPPEIGGTGVGLAISNRLISMMGGSLWLEDEGAGGSTIHVTLTVDKPSESSVAPDWNDLRGARVLVADGSGVTRRVVEQLLSRWEMKPTLAASSVEAIALLRASAAAGHPFDMALVDSSMFGISGGNLARRLSEEPELGRPLVTVLSSSKSVSVTDLTLELCPSGFLVKPVPYDALLTAVAGTMHELRDTRDSVRAGIEQARNVHILVVDDDELNQAVAARILTGEGYRVSAARTGIEAIEALNGGGINLILMDLEMPGMGGLEATRLIRSNEGTSGRTCILALTAHTLAAHREQCFAAGMDDFIVKPIKLTSLRKTLSHWLESRPSTKEALEGTSN
jgi:two-component system sensor histidine kinase/response regulator